MHRGYSISTKKRIDDDDGRKFERREKGGVSNDWHGMVSKCLEGDCTLSDSGSRQADKQPGQAAAAAADTQKVN